MLNVNRLKEVKKIKLHSGLGKSLEMACIMQAVDYVSTGGLSDHPECACPVLTSFAIRLNDTANDEQRQLLKPLIPKLIGTRDSNTKKRANYLVWNSIARVMPILVLACDLPKDAKTLKSFKIGQWAEMQKFCNELKPRLKEAMTSKLADAYVAYAADAAYADAVYDAHAAADAAYADAHAADAADAAYTAYAYTAYAYTAYAAAPAQKKFWIDVQNKIWIQSFKGLSKACQI